MFLTWFCLTAREMAQSESQQKQYQEELDRLNAQLRDVGDERRRGQYS